MVVVENTEVVAETIDMTIIEEETITNEEMTITEETTTIEEMTTIEGTTTTTEGTTSTTAEETMTTDLTRNLNPISTLFCVICLTMLEKSMYILKYLIMFSNCSHLIKYTFNFPQPSLQNSLIRFRTN